MAIQLYDEANSDFATRLRAFKLEMLAVEQREIQELASEPEGLVLVTGPRASGKRTLTSALVDLISGQVSMFITNMPSVLPMVKAGRVRALAVTSLQRSTLVPELPAMSEEIPGFDISVWNGIFARTGTPRAAQSRTTGSTWARGTRICA